VTRGGRWWAQGLWEEGRSRTVWGPHRCAEVICLVDGVIFAVWNLRRRGESWLLPLNPLFIIIVLLNIPLFLWFLEGSGVGQNNLSTCYLPSNKPDWSTFWSIAGSLRFHLKKVFDLYKQAIYSGIMQFYNLPFVLLKAQLLLLLSLMGTTPLTIPPQSSWLGWFSWDPCIPSEFHALVEDVWLKMCES